MSNYRPMTQHAKRAPKAERSKRINPLPVIPEVGTCIELRQELVTQEEVAEGKLATPMTKIRWFEDAGCWKQIDINEAGLRIFLQNPLFPEHRFFVITSIIPKGTACYAKAVADDK